MFGRISSKRIFEWAVIFFWASEYCHAPYFTPYLQSLQIGATMIGMIVGCYGATQLVIRIPLGLLTDAAGRYKPVIVAGLFFTTLSSFGLWLFHKVWLIFLFRICAGVAAATWVVMSVAYMSFYRTEDSVSATSVLNGLNSGGKLLAFLLGALTAQFAGYRATLFCSFAVGLIGLIVVLFMDEICVKPKPVSLQIFIRCLRNRSTVTAALLAGVNMMVMHSTVYSFTSTLAEQLGASAWMLSMLSVVFTLVQIFSVGFIKGTWMKRRGAAGKLAFGFVLSSLYLIVLALAKNIWVLLAGQIMAAVANALSNSLLMSECVRGVAPGEKTTAMGVYQAVYSIGMMAGPAYMGGAIEVLGAQTGCLIMAAFVAVVAAGVWILLPCANTLERK